MKKITLMILVSLMSFFAYAQLPEYQFEDTWTGSPEAPPNWIVINEFGPLYTWAQTVTGVAAQPPFGGTGHSAFLRREPVAPTDAIPRDWLVTSAFPMVNNAQLSFQTRLSIDGPQGSIYKMYIVKDTGNPADITPAKFLNEGVLIQSFTEAELIPGTQTVWTAKTLNIPANALWPAGTDVRVGFVMEGNNADQWLLDNIKVTALCVPPTTVASTATTSTTATFSWTDSALSNKWEVEIVGENDAPTQTGVIVNGPLPYTRTGLQPCTRYKIFVRSLCTDGGSSAWTNVVFFKTSCLGENCAAPIIIPPANAYSTVDNTSNYASNYNATSGTGCNATGNYLGGNDVVYSYTPNTSGNYNIEIKGATTGAGVFVYSSCANIGVSCLNGAVVTSSSGGGAKVTGYALTAGTTYYFVISSTAASPTTAYTFVIQQVFCTEPTAGTFANATGTSAVLSWTKAATSINSWEVFVQGVGAGLPTTGGFPVTVNPTYNATLTNAGPALQPSTSYEFYVRESCGGSAFSPWAGPYIFTTSQVATTMPYIQNFENGLNGMTSTNGTQVNKWKVGTDTANGITSNSAFITNNDATNVYTMNIGVVTHLYRDVIMPPAVGQLSLSFDWRAFGESTWDFLRVWVVPTTFVPTPGVPITAGNGNVAVGQTNYNQTQTFNNALVIFTAPVDWAGTNRRLVFEWTNDTSQGTNPPAAIDNINFSVVTCPQPPTLTLDSLVLNQAVVKWTAPGIVPASYDVYVTQTQNDVPTATTTPTYAEVPGLTQTITPLIPSNAYYVYVRAHCSATDKSFWTGPLTFNAPQIPATMDYAQNFDSATPHGFTLINGTKANKWVVGTATNNSAPNSLYISDNNGTTNSYTTGAAAVVHAYRDVAMPATIASNQVSLSFDWKSGGEGTGATPTDRLSVWIVNTSYTPAIDTQITTTDGQLVGTYNLSNDTWINVNTILNASTWANTTKRFVFEWRNDAFGGNSIGAAVDNINIKVVTCPAPTGLALASSAPGSGTFTWVAPAGNIVPASYDYYYNTTGVAPTATTTPNGNVTATTVTISGLTEGALYTVWVRSNCGGGGTSVWTPSVSFLAPQTPANLDYTQNFDGATHNWAVSNGNQANKWMIGNATSNSAPNSLYISNNGAANAYTINTASVVHAYRDLLIPANADQLLLQYDWKGIGEVNDYFRVWLVPINFNPVPGTQITITNSNGGIQVGGNFTGSTAWKTQQSILEAATYAGQLKRLVFEWRNNAATGDQTPAAIDNISFVLVKCPQPTALTLTSNTGAGTTFTWAAPASGAPFSYDYYLTPSATPPTATTTPTGTTTANTVTLTLPNSSNYFFYVRSNCGGDGASIWTGPINFNTPQVPVPMPFFQDFEGPSHGFALSSGAQVDKWYYGTATSSSATHSLYISNDEGVTNRYTTTTANVSHVYRDLIVPAGVTQLDIAFDWRAAGEGTLDYVRAWFVPATFAPTPGTQITTANSGGVQIGANYNQKATWTHAEALLTLPVALQGQNGRIVFEWKANNSGGTQPAGAVDNVDVRAYTCPKPTTLTADQIGMNTARLNWTEVGTASQWEVYVVPTGTAIPNAATVGDLVTAKPYTKTGLLAGTTYQYYVRSVCGTNDKSRWTGPFQFITNVCDVVDQCVINFILTDGGNDGWTENIEVRQGGLLVATLGPQLTGGGGPVTVPVALCKGLPYDVFWIAPDFGNFSSREVGLEIVNPFNGQTVFRRSANTLNSEQGTIIYTGIAFCETIVCPQPVDLQSKNVVNAPNTTQLTWIPVGTETQWEIVAQVQGAGFPSAPGSNPTVITVSESQYILGGLTPSVPYEFYVRAVCGPDNKSFWSGPLKYSIYTPPACADVVVLDDDLEIIAPDTEYVVCPGEPLCVDFSANFYEGAAQTTSYAVESIPFVPPFPTTGGTSLPVGRDDMWGPRVDLPFEFCFYGNVYNAAQVGANGLVRFNVDMYYGEGSGYIFTEQVPNTDFVSREINNAIYGVMQDTNPSVFNAFTNPNINYQVLGNYPCRALVVSFNELAQFGSTCQDNPTIGAQSSQIVIYEVTNIIEVYVKRRVPCTDWQDGRGVIGLQNATGTQGVTPPGRNTGAWTVTTPEAWRFTPNGDPTVTFEWLQDDAFYSADKDINVCATQAGTTVMTARATYNLCNGETVVRQSDFTLRVTEEIVPDIDPIDLTKCGNGGEVTVDLTDAVDGLFADPTGYEISYYATEQNAIDDVDAIPTDFVTSASATIWIRVNRVNQPCFITRSFEVIISNQGPVFTVTPSVSICDGTTTTIAVTPGDFNEAEATYSWTLDGAPLPDTTSSITVSAAGDYEVVVIKNECEGRATSTVTVVPLPVADTQADVTACDSYTLPALSANNKYYTATGGATGTGTEITDLTLTTVGAQTVYIYAVSPDLATCTDESSFVVTINDKPIIDTDITDVFACGSYTLPAPAANEVYYTAAGGPTGTGTVVDITTPIPVGTYEIYVYETAGTDCTAEASFTITVSTPPVANTPADVSRCDVYKLPALSFQNEYRTLPGGEGDVIPAGTDITTTQTIYVYAFIPGNTNCSDESQFTVTITPTPAFDLGGPYAVCQASNATISVNNANFTDADVTYSWSFNGDGVANNTSTIEATEFGTYTLTVTRGDCTNSVSVDVTLNNTAFDLAFTDGCEGNAYSLEVSDKDGSFNVDTATYVWTGPLVNGVAFTSTDREIFPKVVGDYTVKVTTADGCISEQTFPVISTTCDIPRGVSPNADGKNDTFDLTSLGVRKLSIFNRYGQEVFSRNNYTNEWHGQEKNGNELPTGTYFYMIERTNGESKTGWVYLNREDK